jgi:hypothetical protein
MSDEVIWTYDDTVTLEDNGASGASDAFIAADDADLNSDNHSHFPLADFVLVADFGAAVAAGSVVNLYRQDLNIDSTNDAPAPSATYPHLFVGSFVIPTGTSATGYYPLTDVPLVKDQQFSIENKTDQTISAGWDLKATPKTYEPAA